MSREEVKGRYPNFDDCLIVPPKNVVLTKGEVIIPLSKMATKEGIVIKTVLGGSELGREDYMTVLQELNSIIDLLEAEIPANPESPKNKRLRRRMERLMAKYFKDLADAFPYAKLASVYRDNVKPD